MKIKNKIWAIEPSYLEAVENIEVTIDEKTAEKIVEAVKKATSFKNVKGDIAILPLKGLLDNRSSLMTMLFGTSYEDFGRWFDAAVEDKSIGAIILDIDSGGGSAQGSQELSNKIYKARGTKPIIAVINDINASAAYHISSAANEIVITPSGFVGSIGTYITHADYSGMIEKAGVKYTHIQAGQFKTEFVQEKPLAEDTKEIYQKIVNELYETFVNDVARNRNTTPLKVKKTYGEGRILTSTDAISCGMVDRVGTMEDVIQTLQATKQNFIKEEISNNKRNIEIRG